LQLFRYNFQSKLRIGTFKNLKKIILLTLLITSLYSEATLYIGTELGYSYEDFDAMDATSASTTALIKVGYGDIKAYAIELSLDYTLNESNIFSSQGEDGDKIGFDLALIKAYNFNRYFYPYLKVGFGAGEMKIERSMQSKLSYGSYNLGAGCYIPLYKNIDIELAYLYKDRSYEAVDFIAYKKSYKSKINSASIGINVRF